MIFVILSWIYYDLNELKKLLKQKENHRGQYWELQKHWKKIVQMLYI